MGCWGTVGESQQGISEQEKQEVRSRSFTTGGLESGSASGEMVSEMLDPSTSVMLAHSLVVVRAIED